MCLGLWAIAALETGEAIDDAWTDDAIEASANLSEKETWAITGQALGQNLSEPDVRRARRHAHRLKDYRSNGAPDARLTPRGTALEQERRAATVHHWLLAGEAVRRQRDAGRPVTCEWLQKALERGNLRSEAQRPDDPGTEGGRQDAERIVTAGERPTIVVELDEHGPVGMLPPGVRWYPKYRTVALRCECGDLEVSGPGNGNAVRSGDGVGDARRTGGGHGDAIRRDGDGDAAGEPATAPEGPWSSRPPWAPRSPMGSRPPGRTAEEERHTTERGTMVDYAGPPPEWERWRFSLSWHRDLPDALGRHIDGLTPPRETDAGDTGTGVTNVSADGLPMTPEEQTDRLRSARAHLSQALAAAEKQRGRTASPVIGIDIGGYPLYAQGREAWGWWIDDALTLPQEEFQTERLMTVTRYLQDTLEWIGPRAGPNSRIAHCAIHDQEEAPHAHIVIVCVDHTGRTGWTDRMSRRFASETPEQCTEAPEGTGPDGYRARIELIQTRFLTDVAVPNLMLPPQPGDRLDCVEAQIGAHKAALRTTPPDDAETREWLRKGLKRGRGERKRIRRAWAPGYGRRP